jgi:hypothetical protein
MEEESNGIIRLRSKDDEVFELPEKAANLSELVQDSPREEDNQVTEIEIARVNSDCLGKVVEFMKHYDKEKMKDIPTPLGGSSFNEVRTTVASSSSTSLESTPALRNTNSLSLS